MLLVVGYLVSISTASNGELAPIEAVGSLAVLVATNVVVARLATVVFRRAIVRTGRRLRLREVLAAPAG